MKVQNHIQVKGKMCFIIIIKVYQSKKNDRESEKGKQKYEDGTQCVSADLLFIQLETR